MQAKSCRLLEKSARRSTIKSIVKLLAKAVSIDVLAIERRQTNAGV